ncbi:MAG: flagellar FlbD family protein [Actinomycetota bacterium]|nr:flagellar FlbD family protein [Actinomycetota bacterium]
MITLTRISGSVFVLNADLIERIDSTPDTVISLVDGKKYVVLESPQAVMQAIRLLRSDILAMSCRPQQLDSIDSRSHPNAFTTTPHLAAVAPLPAER